MFGAARRIVVGLVCAAPLVLAALPGLCSPSRQSVWVQFDDSGELRQVHGDLGPVKGPEAIRSTVEKYRALFSDPEVLRGLRFARLISKGKETHYKFQQTYQGIEVFDSALIASVRHGRLTSLVNELRPNLNLSIAPRISSLEAEEVARQVLHAGNEAAQTRLVVYAERAEPLLAYAVDLTEGTVVIDARTAGVLHVETQLTRSLSQMLN